MNTFNRNFSKLKSKEMLRKSNVYFSSKKEFDLLNETNYHSGTSKS